MNKDKTESIEIEEILKDIKLEKPSMKFSQRLAHIIAYGYKRNYAAEYYKQERLGKSIIAVVVLCNLFILYQLNVFKANTILFLPVLAFLIGFFLLVFAIKTIFTSLGLTKNKPQ